MLRKQIKYLMVCSFLALPCVMQAQDDVTNAFDDLKRQGTVNEQDSEMRRVASSDAVKRLIQENPEAGYFCFTEDREHDIRITDAIPVRWVERSAEFVDVFTKESGNWVRIFCNFYKMMVKIISMVALA